jgi:Mrp family chromosome partitioning ATPase
VPGLIEVLDARASVHEAIQSISPPQAANHALAPSAFDVLVCGDASAADPSALLGTSGMRTLIEDAALDYERVLFDASSPTLVSDAFPLLSQVDGVIVVARIGSARRVQAEQLREVLVSSGVPLLGVIAICSTGSHRSRSLQWRTESFQRSSSPNGNAAGVAERIPAGRP